MANEGGIEALQVNYWFINARVRYLHSFFPRRKISLGFQHLEAARP